ncbi:Acetolactate synthase large subunit [Thermomonospora echinospora]|uniref:Acetolactate synthase large subunit n=1 Tax=Thermomonospora echinospora TaxID=1992 RepID=A0A1H6AMN0_9ACTN|nr:thiamine pyrophosphate-dependent enzyme [Thermomonospora echinospora]SEG49317.1 Acetolactate synthase large subunit [Thermomonospora echinospora]
MNESTFHEGLAEALLARNVPVFGVAGDSNLFLVDSFARLGGLYVAATHEGGAVLMAAGYASVSGRVGIATITQGAITNTVTALADAARSHHPLVLLTGETPQWDTDNVQHVPTGQIARSTGAEYLRIDDLAEAGHVLSLAFGRAARTPGPVVLGVPSDLMNRQGPLPRITPLRPPAQVTPDEAAVARAANVLARAQRPVLLAGRGAIAPNDRESLLELAHRVGARVATTLRAKDLFTGDPADLGIFGGLATSRANAYFDAADTIISVGASLNSYTTSQGAGLHGKHLLQIDDRSEHARAESFVHGSVDTTVPLLLRHLEDLGFTEDQEPWDLANEVPSPKPHRPMGEGRPNTVDFLRTLDTLDRVLPPDRLLTVDGGRMFFESVRRLSVATPHDYVHTMSMGSIGLGVGLALGASFADPERLSVLVTGDGGLMLGGLSEFTTAVRNRSKLAVFVMNDGCYGAEHHQMTRRGVAPTMSYFEWPDFAPIGRALGGHGVEVKKPGDLDTVTQMIHEARLPLMVDVKLDPNRIAMSFDRHPPGATGTV